MNFVQKNSIQTTDWSDLLLMKCARGSEFFVTKNLHEKVNDVVNQDVIQMASGDPTHQIWLEIRFIVQSVFVNLAALVLGVDFIDEVFQDIFEVVPPSQFHQFVYAFGKECIAAKERVYVATTKINASITRLNILNK